MKRSPLKPKRDTPRRNEKRIQHKRVKPKTTEAPDWIKAIWDQIPDACEYCRRPGTVVHHILAAAPGKEGRRDHQLVVRLCPGHHNMGTISVHLLGSEEKFRAETGCDLIAAGIRNRERFFA